MSTGLGLARVCGLWGRDLFCARRGLCRRGRSRRLEGGKKFNSPLSARGCSPLSPKGKARGVKNKERPLLFAEADSFPRWGKQGERLEMEWCCYLNFKSKMQQPLIRRRTATPSPEGEGLNKGKLIFDLYRLADARHFPRRGKQGA